MVGIVLSRYVETERKDMRLRSDNVFRVLATTMCFNFPTHDLQRSSGLLVCQHKVR